MSSTFKVWAEIVFNIGYLTFIWLLVIRMLKRKEGVPPSELPAARSLLLAFVLLAIGDAGHVGFRVLAYYLGNLEVKISILGKELALVGAGALATAITITLFYIFILNAWRKRYNKAYGIFECLLITAAIVRLILFLHPDNQWSSVVPPYGWSVARNLPLMLQGLGTAYLILRDAFAKRDRAFQWIGIFILLSYAFYMPVIFLVQRLPWIGLLMIPKTLAYLAMAMVVYKEFYRLRNPVSNKPTLSI